MWCALLWEKIARSGYYLLYTKSCIDYISPRAGSWWLDRRAINRRERRQLCCCVSPVLGVGSHFSQVLPCHQGTAWIPCEKNTRNRAWIVNREIRTITYQRTCILLLTLCSYYSCSGRQCPQHDILGVNELFWRLSLVLIILFHRQMGELYKQNGQQLYSEDFVSEDNTGLEKKILKNDWWLSCHVATAAFSSGGCPCSNGGCLLVASGVAWARMRCYEEGIVLK